MKKLLKLSFAVCIATFFSMATASAQSNAKANDATKTEAASKKCTSECSKACCSKSDAAKKSCADKKKAGKKSCDHSHAKSEGKGESVKAENARPVKGEQKAVRAAGPKPAAKEAAPATREVK